MVGYNTISSAAIELPARRRISPSRWRLEGEERWLPGWLLVNVEEEATTNKRKN